MGPEAAGLGNDLQLGQAREQSAVNARALADQHYRIEGREPDRQLTAALRAVVEDLHVVSGQQRKARQAAHGVLIIIEDRNLHRDADRNALAWPKRQDCSRIDMSY